MTTISFKSLVLEADRDFYEKAYYHWVYKFGKPSDTYDADQSGRYFVQGEPRAGQKYGWK